MSRLFTIACIVGIAYSQCGDREAFIKKLKAQKDQEAKKLSDNPDEGSALSQTNVKMSLAQRLAGAPRPIPVNLAQTMDSDDKIQIEDLHGSMAQTSVCSESESDPKKMKLKPTNEAPY